jgi:hypothetical protein
VDEPFHDFAERKAARDVHRAECRRASRSRCATVLNGDERHVAADVSRKNRQRDARSRCALQLTEPCVPSFAARRWNGSRWRVERRDPSVA